MDQLAQRNEDGQYDEQKTTKKVGIATDSGASMRKSWISLGLSTRRRWGLFCFVSLLINLSICKRFSVHSSCEWLIYFSIECNVESRNNVKREKGTLITEHQELPK
ncbi:unnamed protein product [Hermetia illucens]|uniref:Uncharacterized protein n=1 Tax=Hermetia illucens TaxID=343691 RepID=A0A7R8YNT5_HERIL|nr:unnamed protein product [Hermetia illucens]